MPVIDDTEVFTIGVNADMSKIRNTKGNWWEPLGSNIQLAIDDLTDVEGGTVLVGSNVNISQAIKPRENVTVDFLKNHVVLSNNTPFIIMEKPSGQIMQFASVKNAYVEPTPAHTAPIIKVLVGTSWDSRVIYNTVENIFIANTGSWIPGSGYSDHNFDGILCENRGTRGIHNTFRNIIMNGVKTGIHMYQPNTGGFSNGYLFDNIYIEQSETMIWFESNPNAQFTFNQNVFNNVKGQTPYYGQYGVRDICGNGNHFDHCHVWDWYVHGGSNQYDWIITNKANKTYICASTADVLDNGINTYIVPF